MKNSYSKFKATVVCNLTGHDLRVSHTVNHKVKEYCCSKCGKQMTKTIYGNLVPLTDTYAQINKALGDLAIKRSIRGNRIYS